MNGFAVPAPKVLKGGARDRGVAVPGARERHAQGLEEARVEVGELVGAQVALRLDQGLLGDGDDVALEPVRKERPGDGGLVLKEK